MGKKEQLLPVHVDLECPELEIHPLSHPRVEDVPPPSGLCTWIPGHPPTAAMDWDIPDSKWSCRSNPWCLKALPQPQQGFEKHKVPSEGGTAVSHHARG